jgi:hypothetical protein
MNAFTNIPGFLVLALMAVAEGYDDGFDVAEAWTWYRSEFPT